MTRGALRQELDKRNLDTDGPREMLIDRLTEALSQEKLKYTTADAKADQDSSSEISVSSVRSNASSLASCRALTVAKLAGLKARAALLKKKHDLDKQALELQMKREDLDLEMELGEAIAREAAFAQIGQSDGGETIHNSQNDLETNPNKENETNERKSFETDRTIEPNYDFVTRLRLPTLEFSTFSGNSEYYPSFIRAFQSNIASRLSSEEEKLHYLLQYTIGKPRDIVSTCLYLPPEEGYAEAKRLLDRRYGNFAKMAVGLMEALLQYPAIKLEDVEGLDSFAIHLRGSLNALKSLPHSAGSVDVKTIRALVDKVPYHMIEKWRRLVDDIEQTRCRQATFEDFVSFVEVEARIATNPSYGRLRSVADQSEKSKRTNFERRYEHIQRSSGPNGKVMAGNLKASKSVTSKCLFCSQWHETHECPELLAKTYEEKKQFMFENRLCFGCLAADHNFRLCKNKQRCNVCGGWHATVLHRDQNKDPLAS